MATDLPYEIVHQIVSHFPSTEIGVILSLSLVSRSFVVPCQERIFETLSFARIPQDTPPSHRPVSAPTKSIKLREALEHNHRLTSYIKNLVFTNLRKGHTSYTSGLAVQRPVPTCDWVVDYPGVLKGILELVKDSSGVKTVVFQGDATSPYFVWDQLADAVKEELYGIFGKGSLERLVLHRMLIPSEFFGRFGCGVTKEEEEGGLVEIKLSKVNWREEKSEMQREAEGVVVPPMVRRRMQRPEKLDVVVGRASDHHSSDEEDGVDFKFLGPSTWLDLSSVRVLIVKFELFQGDWNRVFRMVGNGLRELSVWVYPRYSPSTALDLSSLEGLEKLVVHCPSQGRTSNLSIAQMSWLADSLNTFSHLHRNIQSIALVFSTLSLDTACFQCCQFLSEPFASIHQQSRNLQSIAVRVSLAKWMFEEQVEAAKGLKDYLIGHMQWVGCERVFEVVLCPDRYIV